MASCSNCGFNGFVTTSTGTIVYQGNNLPASQFGFFNTYPTSCPGGCLYLTNSGYRCTTSAVGTCPNNRGGCGGCGGGCGCNNNSCIMPF